MLDRMTRRYAEAANRCRLFRGQCRPAHGPGPGNSRLSGRRRVPTHPVLSRACSTSVSTENPLTSHSSASWPRRRVTR